MTDLRAIAEKATPGPWTFTPGDPATEAGVEMPDGWFHVPENRYWNARYIAAWSPDRALTALDVIEAAKRLTTDWIGDPEFGPALDVIQAALARWDALNG